MKKMNFTFKSLIAAAFLFGTALGSQAQDPAPGTGWDKLNPSSPLLLNEDFSGFDFFGNWLHANNSNSKDKLDETTGEITPANMSGTKTVEMKDSKLTVTYTWDSCAFAPDWGVSSSVASDGIPVDPDPTTPGVSKGFVEIARVGYGTLAGEFIIDLRNIDYVEAIQYSHSSCGGKLRGFVLCYSIDDGTAWDTLRYQLGNHWALNFTKDIFTGEKTPNTLNCFPSALGMLWEDAILSSNVMLRFTADSTFKGSENQAVRIHDLKVYGDLPTNVAAAKFTDNYKIRVMKNTVTISEPSLVNIYTLSGSCIKTYSKVNKFSIDDLPNGIYILKAQAGLKIGTTKIVRR